MFVLTLCFRYVVLKGIYVTLCSQRIEQSLKAVLVVVIYLIT